VRIVVPGDSAGDSWLEGLHSPSFPPVTATGRESLLPEIQAEVEVDEWLLLAVEVRALGLEFRMVHMYRAAWGRRAVK
jgi:hypothetical protein